MKRLLIQLFGGAYVQCWVSVHAALEAIGSIGLGTESFAAPDEPRPSGDRPASLHTSARPPALGACSRRAGARGATTLLAGVRAIMLRS